MNTPAFRELGEEGKSRWINVELKLVADVGLIGVPNAGKNKQIRTNLVILILIVANFF